MKKILIILLLLILPLISAVEIDMKDEFDQGETLMAKISGNFLEQVKKENILFYREHVRVPLEYDLAKIDNEYYVYAELGNKEPNNYSLRIENVNYMKGATVMDDDLIKEFIITEEVADFSINPGFVITEKEFFIKVQNLRDFKIEIDIDENETETGGSLFESLFKGVQSSDSSVELYSGEIKELEFNLGNETSFRFVELSTENITYSIPVYTFVTERATRDWGEEDEEDSETTEEDEEETTEEDSETPTGEETETPSEEEEEEIKIASTKTCSEMSGIVCGEGEECSVTIEYATDGVCCKGSCNLVEKSNTGKIIGWSMVIIIVVFVLWFLKTKNKRRKREPNLFKIAKGKK